MVHTYQIHETDSISRQINFCMLDVLLYQGDKYTLREY